MLKDLLANITPVQREKLHEFGVSKQRISDMRAGRLLPTEVQVVVLAEVFGVDRHELQDEIALLRATPEQRTLLQRVMGKALAAGVTSLTSLAMALVFAANAGSAMDEAKAFARRLRRARNRANV